jgi:glycosyltransferase involved in cell wall biosynthesis
MTNPAISVIMPVYNRADSLQLSVESILNQTFKDFELLLINDGSSDNSGEVCEKYAKMDARVKVIHQTNGGVSRARNSGLEKATGKYITFCDSDDYVFPDALDTMYREIGDKDILACGLYKKRLRKEDVNLERVELLLRKKENYKSWEATTVNCIKEIVNELDTYTINSVVTLLLKRSIIKDNKLRFGNYYGYEDDMFAHEYLLYIHSAKKIDYEGYLYIDTPNSLSKSHKCIVEQDWIDRMREIQKELISRFQIKEGYYLQLWRWRNAVRYTSYILKGYYRDTRVDRKERLKRWKYMKDHREEWINPLRCIDRKRMLILNIAQFHLPYVLLDPVLLFFANKMS